MFSGDDDDYDTNDDSVYTHTLTFLCMNENNYFQVNSSFGGIHSRTLFSTKFSFYYTENKLL